MQSFREDYKESLFLSLFDECRSPFSGAKLNCRLRNKLEKLPLNLRREVASYTKDGCSPLFMAAKKGHEEIVEYLITVCDVDIEQRGLFEFPNACNDQSVTPLWCAAVSGMIPVMTCLIKHGADINAVSDTGSTPVRSACFLTHFEVVSYLVENGADIHIGNYNGGTCLINSVQSIQLCNYLLKHGANVNAKDVLGKTALHYAIQENRLNTTKLLLDHGADPHVRSKWNEDALRLAAMKGAIPVFNHLISRISYPPEALADAYELLGSTLLDDHNDVQGALRSWELATKIRHMSSPPIPKLPVVPPRRTFNYAREFQTLEDLADIGTDIDKMWMQSLMICERILGPDHKNSLFRLMYRGALYADAFKYQRCIDMWRRDLEIRVEKDTIMFSDTCITAQDLIYLCIDLKISDYAKDLYLPKFEDMAEIFELLSDQIPFCRKLLEIQPVNKKQQENFDKILRCLTHLMYLLVEKGTTEEKKKILITFVTKLIQMNPRSAFHGDTLLHLCVSKLNTLKTTNLSGEIQYVFPNIDVIRLLLDCGAPVNAMNKTHSTPLHIAANTYNFNASVVELLLERGGHFDQINSKGESPKSLLLQNQTGMDFHKFVTLKCLAANSVVRHRIPYVGNLPATLEKFVKFHGP